jgi:voltage-gated potassium channel Kch
MAKASNELKNTTYELFIAALSVLSIANLLIHYIATDPDIDGVVAIMDGILSVVFLCDFLYRFFTAASKGEYFLRQYGWADLLASLPFPQAKLLRLFRLARASRMIRKYGARNVMQTFIGNRGGSALMSLLFLMILVLEFGGMGILAAERLSPDANIKSAGDSLWYIYVTITTVGYGDRFPVTSTGRVVGIIVLTTGIGLFGTLTGFLANAFLAPKDQADEQADEQGVAVASDAQALNGEVAPDALSFRWGELQQLLAEQQKSHDALQTKIAELEQLLTKSKIIAE